MDFKKGLQTLRDMCEEGYNECYGDCKNCFAGLLVDCFPRNFTDAQIDVQVNVVETYAEKHKQKTWLELLLEKMPEARIERYFDKICPSVFFGSGAPMHVLCGENCEKCWNSIAPEKYQKS